MVLDHGLALTVSLRGSALPWGASLLLCLTDRPGVESGGCREVSVLPSLSHPHSLPSGAVGRLAAPGRVGLCASCSRRVSDD